MRFLAKCCYTDTFRKLYENSKIKNNIFNVHGKSFLEKQITTSSEEHSIVLGFNDIDETILNKNTKLVLLSPVAGG